MRLDASVAMVDIDASDVDLAIRVGDGKWPGVKAEFLLAQEIFPVCAPALAAKLKTPCDIYRATIIRDANTTLTWDMWLGPLGLDAGRLAERHSFTDASLALDAAIAGHGVLLAWPTLAADALRAGTLVAPFKERTATGIAYWLVTSATRREPKTVRDFKAWIRDEIRRDGGDVWGWGSRRAELTLCSFRHKSAERGKSSTPRTNRPQAGALDGQIRGTLDAFPECMRGWRVGIAQSGRPSRPQGATTRNPEGIRRCQRPGDRGRLRRDTYRASLYGPLSGRRSTSSTPSRRRRNRHAPRRTEQALVEDASKAPTEAMSDGSETGSGSIR